MPICVSSGTSTSDVSLLLPHCIIAPPYALGDDMPPEDFAEKWEFVQRHYEIHDHQYALGTLNTDYPDEWYEIVDALYEFRLLRSEILDPGGSKSKIAMRVDGVLTDRYGWRETGFEAQLRLEMKRQGKRVDSIEMPPDPGHKIDCYKNKIGVETEWNSKDQTFDRDLVNFRRLHEWGVLAVGVIITRQTELHDLFREVAAEAERPDLPGKYGASTTHWDKLKPRLYSNRGGGCPILSILITRRLYRPE